jgi:FAD/FMN-containing dehydrogenase
MTIDVEPLKPVFGGDLVLPSDSDYEAAVQRWSTGAVRPAGLVAYPKTPSDVAHVIRFATEHKYDLAVRGGGHSTSAASSSDGGVVIDLSRYFAGCEVTDRDGQPVANVGGGCIWKTVDETAIQHGLATVGGTVNHTGCGGWVFLCCPVLSTQEDSSV